MYLKSGTGEGPISVSFSGSGFLALYQLGVARCLLDIAPQVVKRAPKISGASAGALVAAAVVCGTRLDLVRDEMLKLANLTKGHLLGPLHHSVKVFAWIECMLRRHLPENAHLLASGRLFISMTRVRDGKTVVVSEYQSRDDVVQALLCSCFVPLYCGLVPPCYKGVHYVDGGFSDILPIQTSCPTLTVSPFSGEVDICPSGQASGGYSLVISGLIFHLTVVNCVRVWKAVFPPNGRDLNDVYYNGYQDAISFLRHSDITDQQALINNGACSSPILRSGSWRDIRVGLEEEEEKRQIPVMAAEEVYPEGCSPGPADVSWYISLLMWIQAVLLGNNLAPVKRKDLHDNTFFACLIFILLLLYRLPVSLFFLFSYRLVLWLIGIPGKAFWLGQGVKQAALFIIKVIVFSLKRNFPRR